MARVISQTVEPPGAGIENEHYEQIWRAGGLKVWPMLPWCQVPSVVAPLTPPGVNVRSGLQGRQWHGTNAVRQARGFRASRPNNTPRDARERADSGQNIADRASSPYPSNLYLSCQPSHNVRNPVPQYLSCLSTSKRAQLKSPTWELNPVRSGMAAFHSPKPKVANLRPL